MNNGLKALLDVAEEILVELKDLKESEKETIACWRDMTDGLEDEYPNNKEDIMYFRARFNELMEGDGYNQ